MSAGGRASKVLRPEQPCVHHPREPAPRKDLRGLSEPRSWSRCPFVVNVWRELPTLRIEMLWTLLWAQGRNTAPSSLTLAMRAHCCPEVLRVQTRQAQLTNTHHVGGQLDGLTSGGDAEVVSVPIL